MVLEWDNWGWESVDGGMRLCSSKEDNDHRIVSYFGTKIKAGLLSWTKSKTEYSHSKNSYHITVLGTCGGKTSLVWRRER